MTYLIQGGIRRVERPHKYMNRFVDFKLIKEVRRQGNTTHTKIDRKVLIADSEKVAHWLNKRGHNLQWNDDLERAVEMCETRDMDFAETKLFAPILNSWGTYFTQKYGHTEDEVTIGGTIKVWRETRLPTPWLYVLSFGDLQNVYLWSDCAGFVKDPCSYYRGKKTTKGILLDLPGFCASLQSTKTDTTKVTYR